MEINIHVLKDIKFCPYCLGTGKLKVMQSVVTYNGSIRGQDRVVKCKHCNGSGLLD